MSYLIVHILGEDDNLINLRQAAFLFISSKRDRRLFGTLVGGCRAQGHTGEPIDAIMTRERGFVLIPRSDGNGQYPLSLRIMVKNWELLKPF